MGSSAVSGMQRYRAVVVAIYAFVAIGAALLVRLGFQAIDDDIANVARERGSALFRLIELTRDWSARHGGLYAPVTDTTQANPFLDHPRRDIVDQNGRKLTLINPAFMTRQIAEIAEQEEGVRFRITSLKPIRPANVADPWEAESLTLFESGTLKERLAFFADGGGIVTGPAHRYMAPLQVKPACMRCHEFQGYQVGDIRGGISVTMPADKLIAIADQRRDQVVLIYLGGALIVAVLGHMVAWRTRRHLEALEEINRRQETAIAAMGHDLSEAEKEQLVASAVFGNAAEAFMVTDRDNRIVRVNPAFTAITGYAADEVIGKDPKLLGSGRHGADFFREMWRHLDKLGRWEGEIWNKRKNGEIFVAWLAITTITGAAGEGRHVASFIDITRRKEAEEIILYRANYDRLTDLPNRGLFDDRLDGVLAMAKRHRRSFALLYVDLDWFKQVNDAHGHAAGDALLVEAARRMERCVRDADTVARLGGDEFAVILSDLNEPREAEDVARRIKQMLAEPFMLDEGTAQISGSIGIAIYPQHGGDELLLKKSADQALYAAKAGGRNMFVMASPVP